MIKVFELKCFLCKEELQIGGTYAGCPTIITRLKGIEQFVDFYYPGELNQVFNFKNGNHIINIFGKCKVYFLSERILTIDNFTFNPRLHKLDELLVLA